MRSVLYIAAALCAAPLAYGQATPEAFLALVPPVPAGICAARPAERAAFETRVNQVLAKMDEQLRLKKEREEREGKASGEALQAKATGGRKPPTKEEKERLKKMTPQEKMAWAMSQMGSMDPAAMQAIAARTQAAQKAVNVPKDAQERMGRIAKITAKYQALEAEAGALAGGGGRSFSSQGSRVPSTLCPQFTAKYVALLNEELAAIKAALPDFKRQAVAAAEAAGISKEAAASTEAMEAIRAYASRLLDVYKFNTTAD